MKNCKSFRELEKQFDTIKSVVADDTRFIAEAILFIARQNKDKKIKKPKKKPSEWNVFFGQKMKQGMSPRAISKLWHEKKKGKRKRV